MLPIEFINSKSKFISCRKETYDLITVLIRSELHQTPNVTNVCEIVDTLLVVHDKAIVHLYKRLFGVNPPEINIEMLECMLYELIDQLESGKICYEKNLQTSMMIFFASYSFENILNAADNMELVMNIMSIPWLRNNFIMTRNATRQEYHYLIVRFFTFDEKSNSIFSKYNKQIYNLSDDRKVQAMKLITNFMYQDTPNIPNIPRSCNCSNCNKMIKEVKKMVEHAGMKVNIQCI